MGKHTAFIDNKTVYEVWVEGAPLEKLLVHPNMLIIPKTGDMYSFAVRDGTLDEFVAEVNVLKVREVQHRHGIVRTKNHVGQVDTILTQRVIVMCDRVAPNIPYNQRPEPIVLSES